MFKFLGRKKKSFLALIPGWAFDYRIFDTLDLPYNYLLFCGNTFSDFEYSLKEELRKNRIKRVSLFGWSHGGFLACDFTGKNPDIVDEVILVSIRKKYEQETLGNVKKYLKKNKTTFLYKFYRECFSKKEAEAFSWFKKSLMKDYLQNIKLNELLENLAWLSRLQIDKKCLEKIPKIKIVHGAEDKIAPLGEAEEIKDNLPQARLIVFEETGHLPFLRKDFRETVL